MALQQDTKNKTAVLAFGRMNPPTTGHEKLINKTHEVAKQHGGTAHVHASHSNDKKKNPLPQDKKLGYIRKVAHPDVHVSGSSTDSPSILHHASKLHAAGHQHLHVVAGGAATELILDGDADTSITADTDDQIDVKIAGADDFTITANKFEASKYSFIIILIDKLGLYKSS